MPVRIGIIGSTEYRQKYGGTEARIGKAGLLGTDAHLRRQRCFLSCDHVRQSRNDRVGGRSPYVLEPEIDRHDD